MQKGFAPLILLVGILVIIGVAAGAYNFGRSQVSKSPNPVVTSQVSQATSVSSSIPDASPEPTGSAETTKWKSYINSRYNFTLQYPAQSIMDSPGCYDNSKGECVLVIGSCGVYISEEANDTNEKIISVDGLVRISVTKWNNSIKEYIKNVAGPDGPIYQTESIIGSNADEALRQGKRINDGTAEWAPYLDYNYAYFKKDNNLFVFSYTQGSGRGCLVPGHEAPDYLKKSNLNQQEYNNILNNYATYSPENYFKFTN